MKPYACFTLSRAEVHHLCQLYNQLTNPRTLKTADEHQNDNDSARHIRATLAGRAIEDDNGKLKPR